MTRSILLVALVALVPVQAFAQERPVAEAQHLYELGVISYERQEWARCADFFERSFTLVFAPELLFNIGRCHAREGGASGEIDSLQRAILAYARYLREPVVMEQSERTEVEMEVARLRARVAEIRASVLPIERQAVVPVVVVEEPQVEAPIVEETRVETSPEVFAVEPTTTTSSGFEFSGTVTGAALTGVSLITAIILGVVAQERFSTLAETCGRSPEGCPAGQVQEVDSLGMAANAMFGVSGALAAGTGVMFGLEVSGSF